MADSENTEKKSISDIVDLIAKILFGIFAIVFSYLTWQNNTDNFCVGSVKNFVDMTKGSVLAGDEASYSNPLLDKIIVSCGYTRDDLLAFIRANPPANGGLSASELKALAKQVSTADTTNNAVPNVVPGWVALGAASDEVPFFKTTDGSSQLDVKRGDKITSMVDINIRPGAADWRAVIGVLPRNTTVEVAADPVVLDLKGDQKQIWVQVK